MRRVHGAGFTASGSIREAITGLDTEPSFPPVINLVSTRGDLARFLSALTELFAGVYLAQTNGVIAFVHAVTAPSALRLLLPYLAEADARLAAPGRRVLPSMPGTRRPRSPSSPDMTSIPSRLLPDRPSDYRRGSAYHQVHRGLLTRVCHQSPARLPAGSARRRRAGWRAVA